MVVERWGLGGGEVGKVRGVRTGGEGEGGGVGDYTTAVSCELHPSSAAVRHFNPHLKRLSVA